MNEAQLRVLIKDVSDHMRSDDNTKNALAYLEHLTWLLFLKQFDSLEDERELVASVDGREYARVIDGEYRWSEWAKSDITGDALTAFVAEDLLPYLKALSGSPRAETIARLFQSVTIIMKSGYGLKEVVGKVDQIDFHAVTDAHTMSVVYETLLGQTADAGWSGEFYTPRPVVEAMVQIVGPKLGQTVYDPCAGSGGFLVEAHAALEPQARTTADKELLSSRTFYGQESGGLAYFVGTMNLMLHGIDEPQTVRRNTLEQDIRTFGPDDQHSLIFTNPPFGGEEHPQVQQNFPARTSATELLFLQHCMARLARGGTCAIVVPDGVLFKTDQAFLTVRRRLLSEFTVDGIVRLPPGVFATAPGARTNLLFFRRTGEPTKKVRFQLVKPPVGKPAFGKTDPITADHLQTAVAWIRDGVANEHSWDVSYDDIVAGGYDLNTRPRLAGGEGERRDPSDVVDYMRSRAEGVMEAARSWDRALSNLTNFDVKESIALSAYIEERGERAGGGEAEPLVGVTNSGGLADFKGKPSDNRSRYRRITVGDFVYNPMRVNVGSLALCRYPEEEGWVSPEYVVFRLLEDAPFSAEYLYFFLKSLAGREEISRHVQGGVRARLYYANLTRVEVPVPADATAWDDFLTNMMELSSMTNRAIGSGSLGDLAASLFGD